MTAAFGDITYNVHNRQVLAGAQASGVISPHFNDVHQWTGERFRPEWCNGDDRKVLAEFSRYPTAAEFYHDTEVYLYHCPAFILEGLALPYLSRLFMLTENNPVTILDYGCGPGEYGLLMLALGYHVEFADLPSHSLDFLRWRLARRGYNFQKMVYAIGDDPLPQVEIVWCMDVLEHLPTAEHESFLTRLASYGRSVCVNLVLDSQADGGLHHPVDAEGLTRFCAARWPTYAEDMHEGKVRFLIYGDALKMGERK